MRDIPTVQGLEWAEPPEGPSRPKKKITVAISTICAFLLSLFYVLAKARQQERQGRLSAVSPGTSPHSSGRTSGKSVGFPAASPRRPHQRFLSDPAATPQEIEVTVTMDTVGHWLNRSVAPRPASSSRRIGCRRCRIRLSLRISRGGARGTSPIPSARVGLQSHRADDDCPGVPVGPSSHVVR